MYYPTLEQVDGMVDQGNLVPVCREISADLETPVSAYLKVARPPYSFLLESVENGEQIGRYSFIGTEPQKVIKTGPGQEYGAIDPLIPIEKELAKYKLVKLPNSQRFHGGAVGYLSYESVAYFEELPSPDNDVLGLPESLFMVARTYLIFDHLRHKIQVVSHVDLNDDKEETARSYAEAVERIEELIRRLKSPLQMPTAMEDVISQKSAMSSNLPHGLP